jgi:amino acid transporter
LKRLLLGRPLVSSQLHEERLSNFTALGVLSPDCISSSAYGSEEMLVKLVPAIGLAAFNAVLTITMVILLILVLVTLSYREVVMVYTKAGGSYVVTRENFGRNVAQVAAVALLVDYTVTVAVQTAAGTDALVSAFPSLQSATVPITIGVVLLLLYGNLRGIKEAGQIFAVPTYTFIIALGSVIVVGYIRAVTGHLGTVHWGPGIIAVGHGGGHGWLYGASLYIGLAALANGGSSLTGLEAVSNGVSAFRPPEGRNARKVLVVMAGTLGFLVLGVSLLAHWTHAIPYVDSAPTVIAQEARLVFGASGFGTFLFYVVQFITLLVLWTGANTSFNGFPYLANFVAEDAFLPRMLTKRGHRLAFSNGIILLAVLGIALLLVTRAQVDSLVAVYAVGVFTGFTLAGAGMVRHHLRVKEPGWRHKIWINGGAAVLSFLVVLANMVTKFTEGAWVVLVVFIVLVPTLIRLNRQYVQEDTILGQGTLDPGVVDTPQTSRHVALVLVDRVDLATLRAIHYARTLEVDSLRAVHFVIDAQRARALQERWARLGRSNLGRSGLPLEFIECPDRRLARACSELAFEEAAGGSTEVSVLLPRRAYSKVWSRFLHDQTAERLAAAVSRLPHVTATIVPFDVEAALEMQEELSEAPAGRAPKEGETAGGEEGVAALDVLPGCVPISSVQPRQRVRISGRVRSVTLRPWGYSPTLECVLTDQTGRVVVAFLGRSRIAGIEPGAALIVSGTAGLRHGHLTIINPTYELLTPTVDV